MERNDRGMMKADEDTYAVKEMEDGTLTINRVWGFFWISHNNKKEMTIGGEMVPIIGRFEGGDEKIQSYDSIRFVGQYRECIDFIVEEEENDRE